MIWMLDTNTIGYLVNRASGHEGIRRRLSGRSPGEIKVSAITLAEIQYGLASGAVSVERAQAFTELLELFEAEDFPADAARTYGEIRASLEKTGRRIGPHDLFIAAHARHIGAVLVTNNEREFRRVPGLSVQNWLKA